MGIECVQDQSNDYLIDWNDAIQRPAPIDFQIENQTVNYCVYNGIEWVERRCYQQPVNSNSKVV